MEKKTKVEKSSNIKKVIATGAGVAILGATAYLLLGPDGKKNQKAVKNWAIKMKKEVVDEFKKAKKYTKPVYHDVVNKIHEKYKAVKSIDNKELKALAGEIKKHWDKIEKHAKVKAPKKAKSKKK